MNDIAPFERGALIYPQPVAIACDRIRRARTEPEQVETILKCAEIVTRYLTAVSISSFCARSDSSIAPSPKLASFKGPLSFGSFLNAVRNAHDGNCDHPLRNSLREAFHGKIKQALQADRSLNDLMDLRNDLGHNLMSITEARAIAILDEQKPDSTLVQVLQRLEPILSLPLFLVDDQQIVGGKIVTQRLLLMGSSADPAPELLELTVALLHRRHPYLGFTDGVLDLAPFLIWDVVPKKGNFGLYLIHEIGEQNIVYQSVSNDERDGGSAARNEVRRRLDTGDLVFHEQVAPVGRISFLEEWHNRRTIIEQMSVSAIPWNDLDPATMQWYSQRLGVNGGDAARQVIRDRLLDGREYLRGEELRQIVLLFGREDLVRKQLGRSIIDLRAVRDPQKRWDERVEIITNVIVALRHAVDFFSQHIAATSGVTIEGLTATSGSADYIAIREALVNLFIHQDYGDPRSAGQIEIAPERTRFFNPGYALVGKDALAEGGTSQARNPLISRALKLIGFAELAGSGLRQVYQAWNQARRWPPEMTTDSANNSFTLVLDWRPMPVVVDTFWQTRIGLNMSPAHAAVVILASEPNGVTVETIAASQSVPLAAASKMVQWLVINKMVTAHPDGRISIDESRRTLVDEAKAQQRTQSASAEEQSADSSGG
jgi:hypothetical protein